MWRVTQKDLTSVGFFTLSPASVGFFELWSWFSDMLGKYNSVSLRKNPGSIRSIFTYFLVANILPSQNSGKKFRIIIWYWRFFNCGLGILPKMITISKTSDAELFKASKIIEIHFETAKLQRFENQYTMKCLKFGPFLWHCKDDWIFAVLPDVWLTFRRGSSGNTHIKPISKWKSVSFSWGYYLQKYGLWGALT